MNTATLQKHLNSLGYLCGPADGLPGPRTKDATRRFQASWNLGPYLAVDGIAGPKTRTALTAAVASGGKISAHFRASEFRCKCCGKYTGCAGVVVERADLIGLEKLRDNAYPKGLKIVSGYRCGGHNRAVGGAKSSRHLVGDAFDIPAVVPTESDKIPARFKGRGRAKNGRVRHLDSRPNPARWNY